MSGASVRLWLRWSWRDLRRRWLLVAALALIIALGTGAYAGLGGTTAWRLSSNDDSYALLHMHDLRVRLPEGGFVRAGVLDAAARGIPDATSIAVTEERLVVPTQVDASSASRTVLVPGDIVGMPTTDAPVDALYVEDGRGLAQGETTGVLEAKFARDHKLRDQGSVVISGGERVSYVGTGYTPEYFRVTGRSGQLLGETGFAVLFMPLSAAQHVTGRTGMVNDLVLRLAPGANRAVVQAELERAVVTFGGAVTNRDDDPVYTGLYADAHNDQKIWNMFAVLILLGAAVAAFNLVTRLIDAQRREVGVGMALGVSPRALALRPLLVGVQVAVGGVIAGVGAGVLMGMAMRHEMAQLLPLPIWNTPFQLGRFAQAAALGFVIPLAATVLPLRRVLRLQPVDAIRTGAYGSAGGGGRLGMLVQRLPLPGRSYLRMPARNVLRAPRRTALTTLGVAAAVTCFVAVVGMFDSFAATGDRSEAEVSRVNPDRMTVTLSTFLPQDAPQVSAIAAMPGVAATDRNLRLPIRLMAGDRDLDASVELLDLHSPVWAPSIKSHGVDPAIGIVLSDKAAADLHVRPGDTIRMRHPVRTANGFELAVTTTVVSGVHPNPLRPFSYMDASHAALFGLDGLTNSLTVVPAVGTSQHDVQRGLFDRPGVAAVEPASGFVTMLNYRLDEFTGILRVLEVTTLLLALLIAFNTASLSADERAREHATMFAFGLSPRVTAGMAVAENAIIGAAGTLIGIGGGVLALRWIMGGIGTVMPDLQVIATLSPQGIGVTVVLGVLVVALAPLLNVRKQRRMDVPSALRVVE